MSTSIDPSVSLEALSSIEDHFDPDTQTETWNKETQPGGGNKTTLLESIIASYFVDSMSRYGSHQVFYTAGITNEWPPWGYERVPNFNYTLLRGGQALVPPPGTNHEMKVDIIIEGHSYQASRITNYLAMAVKFVHIIIAICHTLWVGGNG